MVEVSIDFHHVCTTGEEKDWFHIYEVRRGATISKLKKLMVAPNGSQEDANAFELRRAGKRIPDSAQIWEPVRYSFNYLGMELGQKKAELEQKRDAGEVFDLTGRWMFYNPADGHKAPYIIRHDLGDPEFTGHQIGMAALSDGKLRGMTISWTIGDFKCRGTVEDKGRSISDIDLMDKKGTKLGKFMGIRSEDDEGWEELAHYDLKKRPDAEQMKCLDVEVVKRKCEKEKYSGFALWKGFAYMKAGGAPLTKEDLTWTDENNPVTFYLYTPPAVYGELPEEEREEKKPSPPSWEQDYQALPKYDASRAAAPSPAAPAAPKQPAAAAAPVEEVAVTVKHAMPDMASQVTLKVMSNITVRDLRRAIMAEIGESRLSEIKLVKKKGSSFEGIDNDEPIGLRREFLSMGRHLGGAAKAAAPAAAPAAPTPAAPAEPRRPPSPPPEKPKDVTLTVHSTVDYSSKELTIPFSYSIVQLKTKLCNDVKRGPPTAKHISCSIWDPLLNKVAQTLADSDKIETLDLSSGRAIIISGVKLGPPEDIQVTLTHATAEYTVTVTVPDTMTINDLRRAVATRIKSTYSDVRIVKKMGASGYASIPDSERLNGRTEFLSMGKGLEKEPPEDDTGAQAREEAERKAREEAAAARAAKEERDRQAKAEAERIASAANQDIDLNITVFIERSMDFKVEVTVKKGQTFMDIKMQIAASDPTGNANPNEWHLGQAPRPGEAPIALPDSTKATEAHLELDLIPIA